MSVNYCGKELTSVPDDIPRNTQRLELSCNRLTSLASIEPIAANLRELIVDDNLLRIDGQDSSLGLPACPKLTTLTLNKNCLGAGGGAMQQLDLLLALLARVAPNLSYLSLLGNPVCPDNLYGHLRRLSSAKLDTGADGTRKEQAFADEPDPDDKDDDDYFRYRMLVIHSLPQLRFLDSSAVTAAERDEARRRAKLGTLRTARPPSSTGATSKTAPATYTPLSADLKSDKVSNKTETAAFGKCRYVYYGKNSEGNRFIKNLDL